MEEEKMSWNGKEWGGNGRWGSDWKRIVRKGRRGFQREEEEMRWDSKEWGVKDRRGSDWKRKRRKGIDGEEKIIRIKRRRQGMDSKLTVGMNVNRGQRKRRRCVGSYK